MLPHTKFSNLISEVHQTPDCRLLRESMLSAVVVHHTANVATDLKGWQRVTDGVVKWLITKDKSYVSAHFLIARDGKIIQLCDPTRYEAFHAGVSSAWHQGKQKIVTDWNRYAVGIELMGDGNKVPYTQEQYKSLILLLSECCGRFNIRYKDIKGHDEISYPRKNDPGALYDSDFVLTELVKLNSL